MVIRIVAEDGLHCQLSKTDYSMLIQPPMISLAEIHNTNVAKKTATIHVSRIVMISSLRCPVLI